MLITILRKEDSNMIHDLFLEQFTAQVVTHFITNAIDDDIDVAAHRAQFDIVRGRQRWTLGKNYSLTIDLHNN